MSVDCAVTKLSTDVFKQEKNGHSLESVYYTVIIYH